MIRCGRLHSNFRALLMAIATFISISRRSHSLITTTNTTSNPHDYGDALRKSLLFFEAQRSGHLPHNQQVGWRRHSGLLDGIEQSVDLVGGYYDAGDNVKFGFPMAFTITMLSWAVVEYGGEMVAAGEHRHALDAIKWGTDYFLKAHAQPNLLWVQVGEGDTDHYCWQRSEDMTTSRRAFMVDEENPGSEVAAETAAAMAAASIVFRATNRRYSDMLLDHAQQLFEFGDKYRGNYDDSVREVKKYYPSHSGYKDELLWAAFWLYKATRKDYYMEYAVKNAAAFGGTTWAVTEFSWDIKFPGLQILAAKVLAEKGRDTKYDPTLLQYKAKAEHYICGHLSLNLNNAPRSNVRRTPGGLLYTRRWNNMQHVSNAAFLLTLYSDHLVSTNQTALSCPKGEAGPHDLLALARSQADYILGSNPRATSYLVGYGPKYPQRVHHRGASIVSFAKSRRFIGCMQGFEWHNRPGPNPNVLVGALVGGPDDNDEFRDARGNYVQTEACTYNTAPLVGVFARLHSVGGGLGSGSGETSSLVSSL